MREDHETALDRNEFPAWYDEVSAALAYSDHLVFSGNLRDLYPTPDGTPETFKSFGETLWGLLSAVGFKALLIFDPIGGLRISSTAGPHEESVLREAGLPFDSEDVALSELREIHRTVTMFEPFRIALFVDYASHLVTGGENAEEFFVFIDRQSRSARQTSPTHDLNPTLWVVDQPADLPDWFVLNNAYLREIQVEDPNLEDRFHFARHLASRYGWLEDLDAAQADRLLQQFALECDGKPLAAMDAIARVANAEKLSLERISDAIRVFRTGLRRNPWASPVLRARIQDAKTMLDDRIKGQPHAIDKTLEILARSILGLSGVQSGAMHTRPRGALFFVGPTGVGKTELAKAVTELLFADETLCHRFDMSEFMEENSISRLIGAPPGHPGHEKGGELVNAAHRRPFSVFLFDEVEKAHPRVLDLFLQILDEGRLTDSRGATAYFSEALLIFTSNIGIVQGSRAVNMGMNVLPSDSHSELTIKITRAVQEHFRNELQRPELLNRIGQNVVVFDFLGPSGMSAIFDSILERVLLRVEREQGVQIAFEPDARRSLKELCIVDAFEGGRGIANRIETHLINPLARALFLIGPEGVLTISAVNEHEGKTHLVLAETDPTVSTPESGAVHPTHPSLESGERRTKRPLAGHARWRDRFERQGN